ncbi:hypothetical protein JYK22_40325, partial [Nonomuraea sp. RK-328]|nr:hypothetical protein [Nonomuraea sp. RK-328]
MRKFFRAVLVAVPVALALVLSALSGAPDSAAEPLTYDHGDCDRIPSLIVCTISYKGGVQPVVQGEFTTWGTCSNTADRPSARLAP